MVCYSCVDLQETRTRKLKHNDIDNGLECIFETFHCNSSEMTDMNLEINECVIITFNVPEYKLYYGIIDGYPSCILYKNNEPINICDGESNLYNGGDEVTNSMVENFNEWYRKSNYYVFIPDYYI